jgi:hypothetical protein
MAQVRGQLKRAFLNGLYLSLPDATPLQDGLNAFLLSSFNGVKTGRLIEATSQNGHSVKFRVPVLGEHFRQEDVVELAQELREVYTTALVTLNIADNSAGNSDPQVLAQMLVDDRMQGVTETQKDYTLINYPNRFP